MSHPVVPFEIPLWPADSLPAIPEEEIYYVRSDDPAKPNGAVEFVSTPTLRVFLPPGAAEATPAVVICPGGAYVRIAIDKEGLETARWLNRLGIAAILLKYRLPRPDLTGVLPIPWPVLDGLRALRTVRHQASRWNIDSKRVGIMGFSAGGHLASFVATLAGTPVEGAGDPIELESARPDFLMLVYPVTSLKDVHGTRQALLGAEDAPGLSEGFSTHQRVSSEMPPCFGMHTRDDASVPFEDTLAFQAALHAAGVPCEVQIFEEGGHGFGLDVGGDTAAWPDRAEQWFRAQGILPAA